MNVILWVSILDWNKFKSGERVSASSEKREYEQMV